MQLVVISVVTTGFSVADDDVHFVGAQRLCANSGEMMDSFGTEVRPEQQRVDSAEERQERSDGVCASLLSVSDSLIQLSAFVGDDTVVAHHGPLIAMPVIREQCSRHGLQTRRVRLIDSADMFRKLLGAGAKLSVVELAKRFRLTTGQSGEGNPELHLRILAELVQRTWALLAPEMGKYPVPFGSGVLPQHVTLNASWKSLPST
jgi:DNA polymerase III alpha subunit (gram-positive type)